MRLVQFTLTVSLVVFSTAALARSDDEPKEPAVILEVGGVPAWSVTDAGSSFGPTFALEITPIENWLELEVGTTSSYGRHSTEWSTDLLFKKPWGISPKLEFMAGIGPEWVNTRKYGNRTNSFAAEAVLDFMFWPSARRRMGWYFEPFYDYSFQAGHEKSVGAAIGLLIGIHRSAGK